MPALSDKQKKDLAKHIEKKGGSATERRSHRMKMISRMSRGMSIKQAHADMLKADKAKGSSAKPMDKKAKGAKVKQPTGFERKNRGKGKYSMSNPIDGQLLTDATHALYGGFNGIDLHQSNHRDEDAAKSYLSRQPHGKRGLTFKTMDLTSPAVITVVPTDRDVALSKDDIFDKARELDRSGRLTGRPNFIVVQN